VSGSGGQADFEQGGAANQGSAECGKALPVKSFQKDALKGFQERLSILGVVCRGRLLLRLPAESSPAGDML
jgi:hypothetical protein